MEFINHTPFPALAFEGIDQHDQSFHVIALRQTLVWNENGELTYADEQAPLREVDTFFGDMNVSSVRQESDLCQYKPKCDVIVNATAHAPQGKPVARFNVRLVVRRPDTPAPLPERPQGLNQFMSPSPEALDQWLAAVEQAKRRSIPGAPLIDKTLTVTGERSFVRQAWPLRAFAALLKRLTFRMIDLPVWKLGKPGIVTQAPLRSEYAFGGQCRINAGDRSAERVHKKHRLTPEQLAGHPDAALPPPQQPVAHTVLEVNPIGRGFAEHWYLDALDIKCVPAPQIEPPDTPITLRHFMQCVDSKLKPEDANRLCAVLGVRPKGHPDRAKLAGTIDDAFAGGDAWLPEDFDFAVWNAAPPDQQIGFLAGDEVIELTNLCAPGSAGARQNTQGDTVLTLALPRHACFLMVRLDAGEMFAHPMSIDTVIVEPDSRCLTLVWRTVLAREEEVAIRAVEARMHTFEERDRLRQEIEQIKQHIPMPEETPGTGKARAGEVMHG